MGIVRRSVHTITSPRGLADALGLIADHDEAIVDARDAALGEVASLWPVAALTLLVGPSIFLATALSQSAMLAQDIILVGVPIALIGLAIWAVVTLPKLREWPSHHRNSTLAALSAVLGILLSLALSAAHDLPNAEFRLSGAVAAFGAIVIVAIALHAVRAASLAFSTALALMVPATTGFGVAAALALTLAGALAAGIGRVAARDRLLIARRRSAVDAGRLATRLVGEYEAHGNGWFWQSDRFGHLTYLSAKVAREIAGLGVEPIGERLSNVFRVDSTLHETERTLTFHLSSRTGFADYSVRAAFDGAPDRWWSISGRPVLDERGRFQGFIGSGCDLTEKRRQEAEITRLALFDSLTGLANRQRMRLSIDQTLSPANAARGMTALFLLDLDRFKAVNDTLGHHIGDELLKQVAQRLQRTVGDAGLVGRLGGDEFQVLVPREGHRDRLGQLARSIIAALSQPYVIEGAPVTIGCSIGVAIAPEHGDDAESLVRNADLALYAAKGDGRGVHRFYRDELLAGAQHRKRLEDDLRAALAGNQFHLAYQPVVSTADERIVGYEALLRWDHPTRGSVSPADFISVAEECGLIGAIGEWALRTACAEAATWPDHVRVAVNVSPIQFAHTSLPAIVTNAIAAAGISASRLELEITEGVFLNDGDATDAMFAALKGIGVRLALDDFGTGYSSLGYLKKAPFDKIKIDQSFVRDAIQPGNRNAAIIKAIVTLADTLYMETTAEGVEQQDEIALIRSLGCSHIQGYVYGRPARAADVLDQLAAAGGKASAIGYKVSRGQRTTMLRSARIAIGDETGEVRIRNISSSGAMIDGVDFPDEAIGVDVLIELIDSQLFPATVRWTRDGKAGLEFAEGFNLERLNAPPKALRRAG
ncbi:EAL domain-containing protein [Sphingomonas sp. SUN019]|uniref:EAL domain-containing protein n=1 Tax=Sphingomonas sp. SUN019 TaxID=2937788 RepID=UPI002164BBB2|nr:EAL domain-containing protein [Sphingomonas sp. SUN019]UVO50350.1 EAL domain-containing protein [Sphingomonas sp. SUN019]